MLKVSPFLSSIFLLINIFVSFPCYTQSFSSIAPTGRQQQIKTNMGRHQQAPLLLNKESVASSSSEVLTVNWTVANLFQVDDKLLVVYHAAGTAWDNLVPLGALVGLLAYQGGLYQPYPTAMQSAGHAALYTGLWVMGLGVIKLSLWDVHQPRFGDMEMEARRLKLDYNKRVMDQSAWIGCGLAAIVLAIAGGPTPVGLAPNADGVLQGLSLGTVVGSLMGWYRQASTRR